MNKFILFFALTLFSSAYSDNETKIPSFSGYANRGNTFDYTISAIGDRTQFLTLDAPVKFDKEYFDFDCRFPSEIILKKKGNYLVMFGADRSLFLGFSLFLQFTLNDQLINTLSVPQLPFKLFLQNIVPVEEPFSVLKVSFSPNDTEGQTYGLEQNTPTLTILYLSPLNTCN